LTHSVEASAATKQFKPTLDGCSPPPEQSPLRLMCYSQI